MTEPVPGEVHTTPETSPREAGLRRTAPSGPPRA